MSLPAGSRLGPYEVLSAIGAGGMGEVYKARDTRLERVVALKIIQPASASSPEMRERFEREARAISALDHPHICMLYDVCRESPSGAASGEAVSFLVMQYLEGETLADRLARTGRPASDPSRPSSSGGSGAGDQTLATLTTASRGPIPFDTTLRFAAEIAHALDAAHRRGIVHRDLKPGNVMLTKAGTKLLDFGLAKLATGDADAGIFGDATRTSPLTSQGAILGTLHYMSPEQLEGREVDPRSDIHAFGALLFEMLSGRRAFEGQSQAGIIAAIISTDPPALTTLADAKTSLPVVAQRALDRLLARCLAKNPDDRWQSAADLAAELQWINEERLRAVPESAAVASSADPAAVVGSHRRERIWMAVAATAIVALAGLAYWWYPRPAPPPTPIAFMIESPPGESISTGPGLLTLSPDGKQVAFTTGSPQASQLWIRTLASLEFRRLDKADGAWHPVWSPDGRSIAFVGSGGAAPLRKVDVATGITTTLAPAAVGRVAWSRAGVILFVTGSGSGSSLQSVSDAGSGTPTVALAPDPSRQETGFNWPTFLPDGRRYLISVRNSDPSKEGLYLASVGSTEKTFLLNVYSNVDYSGGYLFYQRQGTLMAHAFDADAGRLIGVPETVIENIRHNEGNGRGAFSVSESGVLAFVSGTDTSDSSDRRVMLFDRTGRSSRQIGAPRSYTGAVLSPDGRRAIVSEETSAQSIRMLSLMDMDRGVLTRFTPGSDDERGPVWSPDGSSVVFGSRRAETYGVYRRGAGGGATKDEPLFSSTEPVVPTGFSSDGSLLLITRGSNASQRVWVLPVNGDRKPVEAFPGSTMTAGSAVFSHDGKWIAYSEHPAALDSDVYIRPYPADDRRVKVSPASGRSPNWLPGDKGIVYRASDDTLYSVEIRPDGRTLRALDPVVLFKQARGIPNNWYYSTDKNVEKFLMITRPDRTAPEAEAATPVTVMVNFVQTLRKN
jgi:serine/threonine protein kinase/Tol biopolymer transport system component